MFGFQRLDVYRCATAFLAQSARLADRIPPGHGDLADQLRRAALSIPLNIAEGTAKNGREARRFYTIAKGSALECAAIVEALGVLKLAPEEEVKSAAELLDRIVAMLTKMTRG